MNRPSAIEERIKRQAGELLAIIQIEPRISTPELASRTGMSEGVVRDRMTHLRNAGKITGKRGRARPTSVAALSSLSIEERVSNIEQLLLRLLSQRNGDGAP